MLLAGRIYSSSILQLRDIKTINFNTRLDPSNNYRVCTFVLRSIVLDWNFMYRHRSVSKGLRRVWYRFCLAYKKVSCFSFQWNSRSQNLRSFKTKSSGKLQLPNGISAAVNQTRLAVRAFTHDLPLVLCRPRHQTATGHRIVRRASKKIIN